MVGERESESLYDGLNEDWRLTATGVSTSAIIHLLLDYSTKVMKLSLGNANSFV